MAELETVFEGIEGVKGACAVEIIPNEGVLAVLVSKLPNSCITEEMLEKIAEKKLQSVKFKGGIYIVDEIPRTLSVASKVVREEARELALKLAHTKQLDMQRKIIEIKN